MITHYDYLLSAELSPTEQLTSHGENPNQQADIPVSKEHHFGPVSVALPLSLPGLSGGPHPCPQNKDVEHHHRNHTRDIQCHGGQPLWSTLTDRSAEWITNTDTVFRPRVCTNKGHQQSWEPDNHVLEAPQVAILLMLTNLTCQVWQRKGNAHKTMIVIINFRVSPSISLSTPF